MIWFTGPTLSCDPASSLLNAQLTKQPGGNQLRSTQLVGPVNHKFLGQCTTLSCMTMDKSDSWLVSVTRGLYITRSTGGSSKHLIYEPCLCKLTVCKYCSYIVIYPQCFYTFFTQEHTVVCPHCLQGGCHHCSHLP